MVFNVQFCSKIGILSNYKKGMWCMWLKLSVTHSFLLRQAQAFLQTASWQLWVDSCRGTNPSYFLTFFPQEGFFSSKVFLYKFLNIWDGSFLRPQILGLLSNIPVIPSSREFCLGTVPIDLLDLGRIVILLLTFIWTPFDCCCIIKCRPAATSELTSPNKSRLGAQ